MGNGGLRVAVAMAADKLVQQVSLKEKLAAYKAQASGADKADTEKAKRRFMADGYGNKKCGQRNRPGRII